MALQDDVEVLGFEMSRRVALFQSGTLLSDKTTFLGYNGDPNNATTNTSGETLLRNSPIGTLYIENNGTMWRKTNKPNNTWVLMGSGSSSGGGSISLPASANWNTTYTLVSGASGDWHLIQPTFSVVSGASANWNSAYTTVSSSSADWYSAYNTLQAASGNWSAGNAYLPTSSNWDSAYTLSLIHI